MADENTKVQMTEKQKVKEITDRLEAGLKELFESEKYKSYLSTMSKFHNYSFNNTLLIALQKPEATLVASARHGRRILNVMSIREKKQSVFLPLLRIKSKRKGTS